MSETSSISAELRQLIDGVEKESLSRAEYLRLRRELISRWCNEPAQTTVEDFTCPLPAVVRVVSSASEAPTIPPRISGRNELVGERADTLLASLQSVADKQGALSKSVSDDVHRSKWVLEKRRKSTLWLVLSVAGLVLLIATTLWMGFFAN